MIGISILGSTGSIGVNTLNVIDQSPGRFKIIALTAHKNVDRMVMQCVRYRPQYAVMVDENSAEQLREKLKQEAPDVEVLAGAEALEYVASLESVDYVMAAIVGAAGLLSTLAAARTGKRILLANKEAIVMAGSLFIDTVQTGGATLLPIDSEHNALFQCMPSTSGIRRILITASGGPFRQMPLDQLSLVTPSQAIAHPIWSMGAKISIDSATMMNKGFEVIEAHWLFDMPLEKINVLLHPQSIVHSLVEYIDGSVLAQLGNPDMRTPIAHALGWPDRIPSGVSSLDLLEIGRLDFMPLSLERYPCLQLAYEALKIGGTAPAILNAANEVAVQSFCEERILFTDISLMLMNVLESVVSHEIDNLDIILTDDARAREAAFHWIDKQTCIS